MWGRSVRRNFFRRTMFTPMGPGPPGVANGQTDQERALGAGDQRVGRATRRRSCCLFNPLGNRLSSQSRGSGQQNPNQQGTAADQMRQPARVAPRSTCHRAPWGFSLSPDQNSPGEYSLRLIDPIFSKLGRPFGQFALAMSALLRRNCWVFNLFKRPFSEPHCTGGLQSRT